MSFFNKFRKKQNKLTVLESPYLKSAAIFIHMDCLSRGYNIPLEGVVEILAKGIDLQQRDTQLEQIALNACLEFTKNPPSGIDPNNILELSIQAGNEAREVLKKQLLQIDRNSFREALDERI
tara:strand:- start:304106 stop:304471 length:366 start_codon:yes stop_codon:yes gene_type:complete